MTEVKKTTQEIISQAIEFRQSLLTADVDHHTAMRLFNGFYEGCPDLVLDLYGSTLVIFNYAAQTETLNKILPPIIEDIRLKLPFLQCAILKTRESESEIQQEGELVFGLPDQWIEENGTRYTLNLTMHQDTSFYLDTRNLRIWLKSNLAGKTVLNTFAYTGSLGIAARAGGAARVIQTDLNRTFLNQAKASSALNDFVITKSDFLTDDFFSVVKRFNRAAQRFDCVILDPPFFSLTMGGKVDLQNEFHRLINKVRPLVEDEGYLVAINNALYLSGKDYMQLLENLCADGYLSIHTLIPIPEDITGYPQTISGTAPTDPAPFNHPTKIAILKVRRKA